MKKEWRVRTELLIGSDNIQKLEDAHVFIAGLGGVGGYAAEQLCRAGIGELTLLDSDVVESSNRNRQIIALISTEGMKKTEVVAERLMRINSELKLHLVSKFLNEGNVSDILVNDYDFIVDAIDTLTPKVTLLAEGVKAGIKIVSSMGSGGRMDPGRIEVCDIADSHHCRFASMVRKYLHRLNINTGIQVVFSPEKVSENSIQVTDGRGNKRSVVGTISYMPAMFGCHCAAEVIREIVGRKT
ncbi:MAG: tRNA threonylcarbamoyladenosine dehydratase [Bacteroidales bacterium]|jgi:tRNA A37 threonylcarbamoyladenosine dehydratase|nr:tRNA threonylcarbamoyladenosine dehydratase [Bacteroidales bacterium]